MDYDYSTPEKLFNALDNAVVFAISNNYMQEACTIIIPDSLPDSVISAYMASPNTLVTSEEGTFYKGYPVHFKFTHREPIALMVTLDMTDYSKLQITVSGSDERESGMWSDNLWD